MTDTKNAHFRKKGPGRKHKQGDGTGKTAKQKAAGRYARGLQNWRNGKPDQGRV